MAHGRTGGRGEAPREREGPLVATGRTFPEGTKPGPLPESLRAEGVRTE